MILHFIQNITNLHVCHSETCLLSVDILHTFITQHQNEIHDAVIKYNVFKALLSIRTQMFFYIHWCFFAVIFKLKVMCRHTIKRKAASVMC